MVKVIKMTHGECIVDDEDYDLVAMHGWYFCNGYAKAHIKGATVNLPGDALEYKKEYMHRFLMNPEKGMFVDHINHNTLDNRRCNLRIVTRQQQQWNLRGMTKLKNKSSKYKGVSKKKRPDGSLYFTGAIKCKEKTRYLGIFSNEYDAAKAYDKAAKEIQGEFACLNFPEE